jgi:hypothetical protein
MPDTRQIMAVLVYGYRSLGANDREWKEAEELEVQVLETRKRVLGMEHPGTLMSMANLAFTWKSQGRIAPPHDRCMCCLKSLHYAPDLFTRQVMPSPLFNISPPYPLMIDADCREEVCGGPSVLHGR